MSLSQISLFSGLSEQAIAAIEHRMSMRSFPKNSILISEGDRSSTLYFILSGRVKVYVSDDNGREFILNTLDTGDYFGELGILDDENRTATVMALEPVSFKILQKKDFDSLRKEFPEIDQALILNLVRRVRQLTDNVKTLALHDVYGRIRKLFQHLSDKDKEHQKENNQKESSTKEKSTMIREKLTQQEIANRVGSSREMVARILKDLEEGGYIRMEKKQLEVLKALPEHY